MKNRAIFSFLLLCTVGVSAQTTSDGNKVLTRTFTSPQAGSSISDVTYFDGLGYPIQTIQVKATPSGKNIVTPISYDALRRGDAKVYLPYATSGTTGEKVTSPQTEQRNYYTAKFGASDGNYAFMENVYEASPMNRVVEKVNCGAAFRAGAGKKATVTYSSNASNDVRRLTASGSSISVVGYYPAGVLRKQTIVDEDGLTTVTFTNTQEQPVLERAEKGGSVLRETYYAYNALGLLSAVVSPEGSALLPASGSVSSDVVAKYCYYYSYDDRGNMTVKKLPGRKEETMEYDALDRQVCYQDGNNRDGSFVVRTEYDNFNRITLQEYGKVSIPGGPVYPPFSQLLASYRYDDYPVEALPFVANDIVSAADQSAAAGYKTYEKLKLLGTGATGYAERTFYYDYKGRLIQTAEKTASGAQVYTSTKYDFVGNATLSTEVHTVNGQRYELILGWVYDNRSRLLENWAQLNGKSVAMVRYTYNDLGQLVTKECGHNLTEVFNYNIQGWQTGQESPQFSSQLRYFNPTQSSTVASYTGNITEWEWAQLYNNVADYTNIYAFSYDGLSRLTGSKQYVDGVANDLNVEKNLSYDRNGNIKTLQRFSDGTSSDNFTYTYSGNQLTALSGSSSGSYTYDSNGNMLHDGLHNLEISYNLINLPTQILSNGAVVAEYEYLYDGTKVSALSGNGDGFVYSGSLVYKQSGETLALESALFPGGRLVTTDTGNEATYFITDHLGSVRIVLDEDGQTFERNDYYPMGLRWNGGELTSNRYRYNGKEEQGFIGIPYSDYGARAFDARLGRWMTQDPLTEKYLPISTYAFCAGNPIRFMDMDGRDINIANLNAAHKVALSQLLRTKEGKATIGRYMNKGDVLTVGGRTFRFEQSGDRAKDMLWVRSSDLGKAINGSNRTYTKKDNKGLDNIGLNDNLIDGINQVIDINLNLSTVEAANTLAHELFVHADKDADRLNEIDKKIKNGIYSVSPKQYGRDAYKIAISGAEDHKELGAGKVKKYESASHELARITGLYDYIKKYLDDYNRNRR